MSEYPIPEGPAKTCHICGAVIVHHRCASCGHEECPEDPFWVPRPSRDELIERIAHLEAQNKALLEALEWALPFALKAPDPSRGKDDVPSPEWLAKKDKARAAIEQAKEPPCSTP